MIFFLLALLAGAVYERLASTLLAGLGARDIVATDLPSPKVLPITVATSVLNGQPQPNHRVSKLIAQDMSDGQTLDYAWFAEGDDPYVQARRRQHSLSHTRAHTLAGWLAL